MLRTGIALASSTREEKGQSWLEKRESSTSLVSLGYEPHQQQRPHSSQHHHRHHHRSLSGRKPRSGTSTPGTPSRRGSRSLVASRRSSKAGLALTSLDMAQSSRPSRSDVASPGPGLGEEERDFVPAIVDEHIRSEIAAIQHDLDEDISSLETSSVETESDDGGIDELEMQRLTRERGFGLGGWIDRLVEWTLFGVEDLPSTAAAVQPAPSSGNGLQPTPGLGDQIPDDGENVSEGDGDNDPNVDADEDYDTPIARDYDVPAPVDKPGDRGGWEDALWLLRVMKHALL